MCFTINVNIVREELEQQFDRKLTDDAYYYPSYYYHAFSMPSLPVVLTDSIEVMQWGLIPESVSARKEAERIRVKTFNARGETISSRPSFAESFISKRCVIPVKGFFEWQHVEKRKIPWYICPVDNRIMSLAGLYSEWEDKETGEAYKTFTIITTTANRLMAGIHNTKKRMPVILGDEGQAKWLADNHPEVLSSLIVPFPDDNLNAHTVGPLISSKTEEKNSRALTDPYVWYVTGTLFD